MLNTYTVFISFYINLNETKTNVRLMFTEAKSVTLLRWEKRDNVATDIKVGEYQFLFGNNSDRC